MMRILAVTIVAASPLLAACAQQPGEAPAASGDSGTVLGSTRWTLHALGNDITTGAVAITLNFDGEGTLTGNDGCNQYRGSYTVDNESIEIGDHLVGTLMACTDSVEARASAYREALQLGAKFALDGRRLIINDSTGRPVASFVPALTSPVGIIGWEVVGYNNGQQGVVSIIIGTEVTASFGANGQVIGNAGCNRYFASFELEGETLNIGPAGATRRFCAEPDGLMQQETLYLEALQSAATFRLDGARLELRSADGALAVRLAQMAE